MCLYVTYPLELIPYPNVIAPKAEGVAPSLHSYPYTAGTDFSLGPNQVPNGVYAVTGPHPSEKIVASKGILDGYINVAEQRDDHWVRLDDAQQIQNSSLYIHAVADTDKSMVGDATQAHHYGYATCENIGRCYRSGEVVGSKCQGKNSAYGFCYASEQGSLECGRTLAIDSRFQGGPTILTYLNGGLPSGDPHRCPAGAPIDYQGKTTMKRLLIGGCMIQSDPRFKPAAEVHVEADCLNRHGPYKQGCMFPGAKNYVPGAVSPGTCRYEVRGCTDPGALNYHSEASINDGSCEIRVPGCTLKADPYAEVDSNTPMHKGKFVGQLRPNVGRVTYGAYQSVLNPSTAANVNTGCVVAIEGCMSATAANYNPKANVNTNTWCIAKVEGCMMPDPPSSSSQATFIGGRTHGKDGGSGVFNPLATVNKKSLCSIGRLGCTDSFAINFDARATINDGTCFLKQDGCLDKDALNFNCTARGSTKCTTPGTYPTRFLQAADGSYVATPTRASMHAEIVCVYEGQLVPPPPSPSLPANVETEEVVSVVVLASGSVEDYTDEDKAKIAAQFAKQFKVDASKVRVLIRAASVEMDVQVVVADAAQAASVKQTAQNTLSSIEAAAAFFAASGATPGGKPISVLSLPIITEKTVAAITPPGPPPMTPVGAIVGGVVGGIIALGLGAGIMRLMATKKKKATYPA